MEGERQYYCPLISIYCNHDIIKDESNIFKRSIERSSKRLAEVLQELKHVGILPFVQAHLENNIGFDTYEDSVNWLWVTEVRDLYMDYSREFEFLMFLMRLLTPDQADAFKEEADETRAYLVASFVAFDQILEELEKSIDFEQ